MNRTWTYNEEILFQWLLRNLRVSSRRTAKLVQKKRGGKVRTDLRIIGIPCDYLVIYRHAVDLLRRCTVVGSNFISIERFSRKSKSNGGINISLYGRVLATLSRRAPRFSTGLFPSPFFPCALKRATADPRAANQPWPLLVTAKYSRSSKQLRVVCARIIQSCRCQWI